MSERTSHGRGLKMGVNGARLAFVSGTFWLVASVPVWSQISASPIADLTPHGERTPPPTPPNLPLPNTDPRDLNGAYTSPMGFPGGGPPRPPPGSGITGGAPGFGGGGPPPGPPRTNDPFSECMPVIAVGVAGSPGLIVQTSGRITFIGEGENIVRRVYLNEEFPTDLRPTRLGYSIGHWEGDTLVIETRGLLTNAVAPAMTKVTRVIERLHKSEDGRTIESVSTIEGLGPDGMSRTDSQHKTMTWRPDQVPLEVVCEDVQNFTQYEKGGS